ncbi:hypothetical protein PGB90_004146 [Kerria lacca]
MGKCLTFYLRKEIIQLCLFAVENSNDNEDVEDDKISPELEELLMKKKRRYDCPLCDSSVYSYCSDKLLHDACCCLSPYETNLPLQCKFADCSFLHANSCQEHRLITACCCNHHLADPNTR